MFPLHASKKVTKARVREESMEKAGELYFEEALRWSVATISPAPSPASSLLGLEIIFQQKLYLSGREILSLGYVLKIDLPVPNNKLTFVTSLCAKGCQTK